MKLIYLSSAWIAGIYIGSLFSPPLYTFTIVLALSFITIILLNKKNFVLWGGLCLIVLIGGIWCYQGRTSEPTLPSYLASCNGQGLVEIKGEIMEDPEYEGDYSRLSVTVQEIKTADEWTGVSGKALVYTGNFPYYSRGDSIKVRGELYPLSQIENQGFRSYLNEKGYSTIIYYPEIEFIQRGWLFDLRNSLGESLESTLSEPQCSLSQALLLGIRSHVPDSLQESFRSSGTAHILAISGLHVAILAGIVLSIAAWLFGRCRPTYLLITFVLIWIYALLSGLHPPAFRATIMFSLLLTALWLGRPRSILPCLVLTAAIIVGINPDALWDISFQLSFAAVSGIIFLYPVFQRWGRKAFNIQDQLSLPAFNPIVDSIAVSTAAIIATFPLIAYYFGYASLTALPATLLIMLALPGAIMLTLITALLGLYIPFLSSIAGWVDWLFLRFIIEVAELFGSLGIAKMELTVSAFMVWIYYCVLLVILLRKQLVSTLLRTKESIKAL